MRPQQQNRRMRGRNNGGGGGNNNNNNNNRKGPNPLTRSYESNGPDVKIRGSAQQIAEKYATLARDASSAGDRVMAENYLQHAEHYNRIIAAAQAQFATQQIQTPRDDLDDEMDEGGFGYEGGGNAGGDTMQPAPVQQVQQPVDGSGPQPIIEGVPAEVALNSQSVGQQPSGGRHRERRSHHQHNGNGANGAPHVAASPEQAEPQSAAPAAEEAAAPAEAIAEEPQRPRRGRRPRRERAPDEASAEAPSAAGAGESSADVAATET